MQQHQTDAAACGLFVRLRRFGKLLRRKALLYGQEVLFAERLHACGGARFRDALLFSRSCHHHHADRDRHAVGDALEVPELLDRVTERVPEVEQHPLSCLALVAADDVALDGHAGLDDLLEMLQRVLLLEKIKERRVLDAAVFDDLAHAVDDELIGQSQ